MKFRKFNLQSDATHITDDRQLIDFAPLAFKQYSRFPQIPLPQPSEFDAKLSEILKRRASAKEFRSQDELSLSHVSDILHVGSGLLTNEVPSRRHHPSGGSLYPLEYYIFPYRVESLRNCIYHYAPRTHSLEEMVITSNVPKHPEIVLESDLNNNPAALILISSVWGRNYPRYGEFAYRLSLIEAGHSVQNMLLAATALSVKARPYGGVFTEKVNKMLDLDRHSEDAIYSILLGS